MLERRRAEGFVRHCHGDLHLRNICLIDGRPTLFDAIEFDERFAAIDVLYDLAFLLVDLLHHGLDHSANLVFNRYLWPSGDVAGLALLPLFLSCRAAIRAHVGAAATPTQRDRAAHEASTAEASAYLDLGQALIAPPAPRLIALGGLSGSGKTTLALALAPAIGAAPGALVLRSDVVRKRLAWVSETTRLGPEAYRPARRAAVHQRLRALAAGALAAGHSVILDAVHALEAERAAAAAIAASAGVAFDGLSLEAPLAVMAGRLASRRDDASDATPAVLARQSGYEPGTITWHRVTAVGAPADMVAHASALLGRRPTTV